MGWPAENACLDQAGQEAILPIPAISLPGGSHPAEKTGETRGKWLET